MTRLRNKNREDVLHSLKSVKESKKKIEEELKLAQTGISKGLMSEKDYHILLNKKIDGKSRLEWLRYCDDYISRNKNVYNKHLLKVAVPVILGVLLLFSIFGNLLNPSYTGLVSVMESYSYTDSIGLSFNSSDDYNWDIVEKGNLESVKINGKVSTSGVVRVYLKSSDDAYLVFDSSLLKEELGIPLVTGLVVNNDTLDESEPILNETNDEENPIINKIITISPSGGGSKVAEDIFEFNINGEFNWNVDFNKICSIWKVNSKLVECYGSSSCCGFINMPSSGNWDDSFYLSYERYDSNLENKVSSQIVYYDVDLEVPYSDIVYSSEKEMEAKFYEEFISFESECVESCLVNLNDSSYELVIVVEDSSISIDSIDYSVEKEVDASLNKAPKLIKEIPNVYIEENGRYALDLEGYFTDDDKITYHPPSLDNMYVIGDGNLVTFVPDMEYEGEQKGVIIARDKQSSTESNVFKVKVGNSFDYNKAPSLIKNISDITIAKNTEYSINLSEYFADENNDVLTYSANSIDNFTINIEGNVAVIKPSLNFTGIKYIYFKANDTEFSAFSELVKVEIVESLNASNTSTKNESTIQIMAVINKPVKWIKKIELNETTNNLTINISSDAIDITVKKVIGNVNVSVSDVKVKDSGIVKNLDEFVAEQKLDYINSRVDTLNERKKGLTSSETKEINEEINELNNEKNLLTGYVVAGKEKGSKGALTKFFEWLFGSEITGYAVAEANTTSAEETELIIEDNVSSVIVEYETPGPEAVEKIVLGKKIVNVSSEIHYQNILAYTKLIDESPLNEIRIYEVRNGSRIPVAVYDSEDINNNGLVDIVYWIVPSLSYRAYEIVAGAETGLVALYHFNQDSDFGENRTHVYDFSGLGNNGTAVGSPWTGGVSGNGLEFDGIDDYVDMGDAKIVEGLSAMTVTAWIKLAVDDVVSGMTVVSKAGPSTDSFNFGCLNSNDNLYFSVWADTNDAADQWSDACENIGDEWHFIVGVYDGTGVELFFDGVGTGTPTANTGPIDATTNTLRIGARDDPAPLYFNGSIDEVQIYNCSVDQANITAANATVGLRMTCEDGSDGLVGEWALNESGSTVTASDSSANSNDGTLTDMNFYPDFNSSGGILSTGAMEFDGAGDYVDLGDMNNAVEGLAGFSVSAWVKTPELNADSGTRTILSKAGTGPDTFGVYWGTNENLYFVVRNTSNIEGQGIWTDGLLNEPNVWKHIVGVYNGTHVQIYGDGVARDATPGALTGVSQSSTLPVTIGAGSDQDVDFWNGTIDEVGIYNRSLSAEEILRLYNMGIANHSVFNNNWNCSTGSIQRFDNASCWSKGAVPVAYDNVIFNGTGSDDVNVTRETMPQYLNNFSVGGSYGGSIYMNKLFGVGTRELEGQGVSMTGLIGLYHLNNDSSLGENSTHVYDSSGNGNNGSVVDNATFITAGRKGAGGYEFDGAGDYILIDNKTDFDDLSAITVSTWIKPTTSVSRTEAIVSKYSDASGAASDWRIAYNTYSDSYERFTYAANTLPTTYWAGSTDWKVPGTYSGKYNHVVWVINGTDSRIYIDGVLEGSPHARVGGLQGSSTIPRIGADHNDKNYFNGSIDEVAIWSRGLSAEEVMELYLEGTQYWNVTGNIDVSNGTVYVYGDYPYNTSVNGEGQVWTSVNGNISVGSSGVIDGVGLGFPLSTGPGYFDSGRYGAAHGGFAGGQYSVTQVYGNSSAPTSLGSGSDHSIGKGGSAIKLDASSGTIKVDGVINMSSLSAGSEARTGAGGSVWLYADNISGSGRVLAEAGSCERGGGGGGRIRFDFNNLSYTGVISAKRGVSYGVGYEHSQHGSFSFSSSLSAQNYTWPQDWTINGSFALPSENYTVNGDLVIPSGSILSVQPYNSTGIDNGTGVQISVIGNVTVESGGTIWGDGGGFERGKGSGAGGSSQGGTHAGSGGSNSDAVYGSESSPLSLGSGGDEGDGGGAIKVISSGFILINGNVTMNGRDSTYSSEYAGGAGGSVWLDTNNISGSGLIGASGGSSGRAGGGAGRIALYAPTIEFSGIINNIGGNHTSVGSFYDGGGGSVYLNASTSITSSGNITTTGLDGGNISFIDTLLTLSGVYNASGTTTDGSVIVNYTDCDSTALLTGTFSPTQTYQSACDVVYPAVAYVSPTLANGSYGSVLEVNATISDSEGDVFGFVNLDNSLVSWWRMDDVNSSGDLVDYMGLNNGSAVDGAAQTDAGKFGKGFSFDGDGDYLDVSADSSLNFSQNYTISLWVKAIDDWDDMSSDYAIWDAGMHTASADHYSLLKVDADGSNNLQYITTSDGSKSVYSAKTAWNAEQWYHVVIVHNSSNYILWYIDGSLDDEDSFYALNQANYNGFHFGVRDTTGSGAVYFNGTLDDVMVFNRSLSNDEIGALYNITATNKADFNYTSVVSDGDHSFRVYGVDGGANVNFTSERTVTVDTTSPVVSFVSPTPENASNLNVDNIYVNLTSTDTNDHYAFADFDNDVVLWMRMDDVNGSGDPIDLSSYGNNGAAVGNAIQVDSGYFGKGFSFDGDGDYVDCGTGTVEGVSGMTISAWVKTSLTASPNMAVLEQVGSGDDVFYLIWKDTEKFSFTVVNDSQVLGNSVSSLVVTDQAWHHVVGTYNGSIVQVYVDGGNEDLTPASLTGNVETVAGTDLTIGGDGSSGFVAWNGTIDEVIIFNRSLSQTEILALYNASSTKFQNNYTNLNDGTHTFTGYAVDRAGNLNQTETRTVTTDILYPTIEYDSGTLSNDSVVSTDYVYVNVSVTEANEANITFSLYNSTDVINSTTYTDSTRSINWTGNSNDQYYYNVTIVDIAGNTNITETRIITVALPGTNNWKCGSTNYFTNATCWSKRRMPVEGDDLIFNGTGLGNCNITNNTMVQNLSSFTVASSYSGDIHFSPLFAVGTWTGNGASNAGTQNWNVSNDINISGSGSMYVYGDYVDATCCNISANGQGQAWQSLSGNITIGSSATVDGVGKGFPDEVGPGSGYNHAGGAHGGYGRSNTDNPYGNASAPTSLGSGGDNTGVDMGGAGIKLESGDRIIINGNITMDGSGGGDDGGAGGSIWLVADNITGSGAITADGAPAAAGGRVRFDFDSYSYTGIIGTGGGAYSGRTGGRPGTFSWGSEAGVTNYTWPGSGWTLNGSIGLESGNYTINGDLVVPNGTMLGVHPLNVTAADNGTGVYINVSGNVTIQGTGSIDGYREGFSGTSGPGAGVNHQGGAHGGMGGANGDAVYGFEAGPLSLGSPGDGHLEGGGAIKLESGGVMVVDGNITMRGRDSSDAASAGGSVWLVADNLTGSGVIDARGGLDTSGGSGGGGGRIALYGSVVEFSGLIDNNGGFDSGDAAHGSGGTVYVNASTSITSSGNILTTGLDGGNITIIDSLLTLSGIYNASNVSGGSTNAVITVNYTNCASTFTGADAAPNARLQTTCGSPLNVTTSTVNKTNGSLTSGLSLVGLNQNMTAYATLTGDIGLDDVFYVVWTNDYYGKQNLTGSMSLEGDKYIGTFNVNETFPQMIVNMTIYANDTAGNNSFNLTFFTDLQRPQTTLFDPTPADGLAGGADIVMNWSVTDNNDTLLDCYTVVDDNETNWIQTTSGSYANKSLTLTGGSHNLSVTCYDNANNSNRSEVRTYIVGLLNITSPLADTLVRPGENIIFNVSIIEGSDFIDNITLQIDNLTGIEEKWMSNLTGTDYNASYTVTSASPRYLTVTAYGFNNAAGSSVNMTSSIKLRLARAPGTTTAPTSTYYCSNETYTVNGTNVTLMITFDADTLINNVNMTILHPNGNFELANKINNYNDSNGTNNYISYFNFSYMPNVSGIYTITANLMDIENQTYNRNLTLTSSLARTVNWSSPDITNIVIMDICTGYTLGQGLRLEMVLPNVSLNNMNITISSEPKKLYFYNANISYDNITNLINHTTRTNESDAPTGERRAAMWDLNSNMSFDNYTFVYNYTSIEYTLTSESALNIYRCGNIDSCVFAKQTISLNTTTNLINLNRVNMSRYILTEPALSGAPALYVPPIITELNTTKTYYNANDTVNITLRFNISLVLDTVTLTVNDTALNYYDSSFSGKEYWYYYNYTPLTKGPYVISAVVYDENTFNDTQTLNFYADDNDTITLTTTGGNYITVRDVNNDAKLFNGSSINMFTPAGKYNILIQANRTDITLKNATINSSTSNVLIFEEITDLLVPPSYRKVLDQFVINSSLALGNVSFVYNYTNKSNLVVDESNLEIYSCLSTTNCTFTELSRTVDTTNNLVSFSVNSFNHTVYMMAESIGALPDVPRITSLNISRTYIEPNKMNNITLRFTTNVTIGYVRINVNVNNDSLVAASNSFNGAFYEYNFSYTPSAAGDYNITAVVRDVYVQNATQTLTFYAIAAQTINLAAANANNITLKDITYGDTVVKAIGNVNVPPGKYDTLVEVDKLSVTLVNASVNNSVTSIMEYADLEETLTAPTDRINLDQFEVNSSIGYSSIEFVYNYSNLTSSITNEGNLEVFKRDNVSDNSNWTEVSATVDTTNNLVTFTVSNLSVFDIVESIRTETTTTTTTVTAGGGGTTIKRVALKFVPTTPIVMYPDDTVTATVVAANVGDIDFDSIDLDISSDNVMVEISREEILDLKVDTTTSFDIEIGSYKEPGIYEIDLSGDSSTPEYTEESKILIQVIEREKPVEVDRIRVVEKVRFAYDLFKENPECIEFQEMIEQADAAIEKEEYLKASSLIEAAINACKETITALSEPWWERLVPEKRDVIKLLMGIVILTLVIWLLMEFWHMRGNVKPAKGKGKVLNIRKTKKKVKHKKVKEKGKKDIWER
jgi:hypothetical protein